MSDTPRTDFLRDKMNAGGRTDAGRVLELFDHARRLERELAEITKAWQEQTVIRQRLERKLNALVKEQTK